MKKINSEFLASLVAIIVGLLFGLVVLLITDASNAFQAFGTILTFGFINMRNTGEVLYFATPLIMTGLAVGFAYKTGLFNIGASGQFSMGSFAALYISIQWTGLPVAIRLPIALISAMLAGAIWAAIPGLLKAYRNVHEVISCIMTNYIGVYLVNFIILNTIFDPVRNQTLRVPTEANLPTWGMDRIFKNAIMSSSLNSGFFLAILAAVIIWVILSKTKFGYELKAVGFNRDAAKYAGINENKNIVLSMMISGALAGLGGALLFLSGTGVAMNVSDVIASEGFTGISVALIGANNPFGIIFSAILIAYLSLGGSTMQTAGFAPEIIEIVIAVIIYLSAFALVIKNLLDKRGKA